MQTEWTLPETLAGCGYKRADGEKLVPYLTRVLPLVERDAEIHCHMVASCHEGGFTGWSAEQLRLDRIAYAVKRWHRELTEGPTAPLLADTYEVTLMLSDMIDNQPKKDALLDSMVAFAEGVKGGAAC